MTTYTQTDFQVLRDNYHFLDKESLQELLPGHSWTSIMDRARRLGLSRPNIRTSKLKKLLDPTILNAYWWGLILSDGHINPKGTLRIHLWEKDRQYLEVLAEYLEVSVTAQASGTMATVEVMDKINGAKLKDLLGIKPRKTYNPPENLDYLDTPEKRLAFLIGFTDGDGCLTFDHNDSFKHLRIVVHGSWLLILTDLCQKIAEDQGFKFTVTTNGRGNASVYLGTKKSHASIMQFIQDNNLPVMTRKWNNKEKGYRK